MKTRALLEWAIEYAGTEERLGLMVGVSQNAIWQAKKRGRVTPKMALALHRELYLPSRGVISASKFCADMCWNDAQLPTRSLKKRA